MAAWIINVDFGLGNEDISAHCSDVHKSQRLHNNLKSTINTCSFTLQDITIANKFNVATTDLPLQITKDGTDWFVGLIRPTFENVVQYTTAELGVEGVDKGILLQQKINQNLYYRKYKVCDTANKPTSILHQLFYKAGLADGELDLTDIDVTLQFYGVELLNKKTYRAEITDLLFEYGYVYNVKDDGVFEMHDLYPTALPALTPIDDADMYNTLKIAKREVKYEAARVEWYPTHTQIQQKVYETTGVIKLAKSEWWPVGSTVAVDVPLKFKVLKLDYGILEIVSGVTVPPDIGGWELLGAYNAKLYANLKNVNQIGAFSHTPGAKEAIAKFQAENTIWTKKIKSLSILADIIVRKRDEVNSPISPAGYGGEKIRDVKTRFIDKLADANRLANGMRKYYDFADFEYRFNTLETYAIGEYLDLTEDVMTISTTLRVVEIQEEAQYGRMKVLCEGADEFTVDATDVVDYVRPGLTSIEEDIEDYGERMDTLTGLDGATYENDAAVEADFELIELSEPDCQSNFGRQPDDKIVHYEPAEYADERGILYRNPHTKMWNGLSEAIFQQGTNLVKSPEALIPPDWTESNAKATLTGQYVNGLQLTKVLATVANGQFYQAIFFTGNGEKGIQGKIRKGDDTIARLLLWDATASLARFYCSITWATQTINCTIGTLHGVEWIDSETVLILGITTSDLIAGNNNLFYGRTVTNGKYNFFTAFQATNLTYNIPYIPLYRYPTKVHPEVNTDYRVNMQSKMVFKIKLKPWFTYDTSGWHRFAEWYIDSTHRFIINWEVSNDKIRIYWVDGGTGRYLDSQQFDDGTTYDDINSELIICGAVRFDQQTGQRFFVIVDGVKQTEDTTFNAAPDAKASTFPTLSIGHENEAAHADSLIESVQVWDWDGADFGTIDNEADFDIAVGSLTERFSHTLEEYDGMYKPLSKRGVIGAFQATENLVDFPEDLTDATWLDLAANITPSLSDYYINGKRFTKLLITDGITAYMYKDVEVTIATPSFQAIFKYGLVSNFTEIRLYDRSGITSRGSIRIYWDTKIVLTADGATNLEYHWISEDIVWVAATANGVVPANDNEINIYPDTTEADGDYVYATAVMAEDIAHPTPYTPIARKKSILNYTLRMPPVFTLMFWVRPWFAYTTTISHSFIDWFVDATHRFRGYYNPGSDQILLAWQNGGIVRHLISQQFDDGTARDNINQWIHVVARIDLTAGQTGSALWVNGVSKDANWGGAIDAYTDDFSTLSIGHGSEILQADSMFNDLVMVPGLVSDSVIKKHYLKNRPWYEPSEIANLERTVKVGPGGIRMHNAALTITDNFRRLIDISPSAGLYATDAAGTPIHDIPDALIQKGNWYLGHDLWNDDRVTYKIYDVVDFPEDTWTDVTCLLNANSNVKKGIFKIRLDGAGGAVTTPQLFICLRPKGTAWGTAYTDNTPRFENRLVFSSTICTQIRNVFVLQCPLGDDNKIQFYARANPDTTQRLLTITQLGLGI